MSDSTLLHALVSLAILGVLAQWIAWRFRLPSIVLLSVAGLTVGPVFNLFNPTLALGNLMQPIIKLCVALILFEGGLNLRLHELKGTAAGVKRLASIGVLLSWCFGSFPAYLIGGFSWAVALVFGAIIVVTGPTVILPLLRQARLKRRPASFLKWEGIINDPTGALLAVIVFEFFVSHTENTSLIITGIGVFFSLVAATLLGIGSGMAIAFVFHRGYAPEFLKPSIIISLVFTVYVLANLLYEEAGLLAVTALGIVVGNAKLRSIDEIRRHNEYIAIFLVSTLFLLLTADLNPAVLQQLSWRDGLLVMVIIFVVRPLSVLLATLRSGMSWQERLLMSWIAPRGVVAAAVAGVFGTAMATHGYPEAERLVPLIFSLILATVVLHGSTIGWVSRHLNLSSTQTNGILIVGCSPWSIALGQALLALKIPCLLADSSWHRLRAARLAGIPVYYGEIMSERSEESLELIDMNYVLAATDNDAYNALVCMRFASEFGRHRVFQLPMLVEEKESKSVNRTLRGNIAFQEDALYEELLYRYYQGWRFQKTRFTDNYTYRDYQNEETKERIPILLVKVSKEIVFVTPTGTLNPKAGDILLSFQLNNKNKVSQEVAAQKEA